MNRILNALMNVATVLVFLFLFWAAWVMTPA